jgi:hypothetical protein
VLPNCMKSYGEWNTIAFGRGIVSCFAGGTNNDRTRSARPLVPPYPRTTSRRDGHPSSGQPPAKKANLVGANKDRETGRAKRRRLGMDVHKHCGTRECKHGRQVKQRRGKCLGSFREDAPWLSGR